MSILEMDREPQEPTEEELEAAKEALREALNGQLDYPLPKADFNEFLQAAHEIFKT